MNAIGYVKSLAILFLSCILMMGFNNCSDVAFTELSDGTVFKISNDIVDTNEIDGIRITDDNVEEYEEAINGLVEEQESYEGDGETSDEGEQANHSSGHEGSGGSDEGAESEA